MATGIERIIVLEARMDRAEEQDRAILEVLQKIEGRQSAWDREKMQYKGFIGGIVFIISCLWAAWDGVKAVAREMFK